MTNFPFLITLVITLRSCWAILLPRGGVSDVACEGDFNWMENSQKLNPCYVAASAQGACMSTTWRVPKLDGSNNYYDVLKTPNACSCSWTVYNLLSACSACQGQENSIKPWAYVTQSQECKDFLSTDDVTYWPKGVVVEGGRSFPFWATVNPSTWQDAQFNVDQARKFAAESHPDISPAAQPEKHESSTGPIVGGVVGGIVIVALGGLAAWLIMRKRKARIGAAQEISPQTRTIQHMRSLSEMSQGTTTTTGYGVPLQQSMPLSPGTIHTHSGSFHSLPHISSQASMFSHSSGRRAAARVPPPPLPVPREAVIEPFTAVSPTSPTSRPPLHRKGTSDTSDASSVPVHRQEETGTRRYNPPAYSAPSNGNRPGHGANPGSLDSQTSWDSSFHNTHSPRGGSLSTMDEVSSLGSGNIGGNNARIA